MTADEVMRPPEYFTCVFASNEEGNTLLNYAYEPGSGEILLRYDDRCFITSCGEDSLHIEVPFEWEAELVSAAHLAAGWRLLVKRGEELYLWQCASEHGKRVDLAYPDTRVNKAVWSRCGKYLAASDSRNNRIIVWNAQTGERLWSKTFNVKVEGEMLAPPTVEVVGWSPDGQRILYCLSYLVFKELNFLDAETSEVLDETF